MHTKHDTKLNKQQPEKCELKYDEVYILKACKIRKKEHKGYEIRLLGCHTNVNNKPTD